MLIMINNYKTKTSRYCARVADYYEEDTTTQQYINHLLLLRRQLRPRLRQRYYWTIPHYSTVQYSIVVEFEFDFDFDFDFDLTYRKIQLLTGGRGRRKSCLLLLLLWFLWCDEGFGWDFCFKKKKARPNYFVSIDRWADRYGRPALAGEQRLR
jgi:hypothetical protein